MMSVYKQVLCFVQYLVEKIGLLRRPSPAHYPQIPLSRTVGFKLKPGTHHHQADVAMPH